MMFARIKALFEQGRLSAAGVDAAVTRGWITQDQADEITNG